MLCEQTKDLYYEGDIYAKRFNVFVIIVRVSVFVLPLIILSIQSAKVERNYKQMLTIGIYIQVTYEYPSLSQLKKSISWEKNRQVLSKEQGHIAKRYEKMYAYLNKNILNSEIYITSIFAGWISLILLIVEIYEILQKTIGVNFIYLLLIALAPSLILTLLQYTIKYNTSIKRLNERYVIPTKERIVQLAISMGIIDSSQKNDCLEFVVIADE